MQANNTENLRASFAIELLEGLKTVYCKIKEISSEIQNSSGKFHEDSLRHNMSSIQEHIENYKSNIEKIKKLKWSITEEINAWYNFTKDAGEVKKLAFPIRFFIKKRRLKNFIKQINEQISGIAIDNRFIKENLTVWEHKLELESIEKIKSGNDYNNFEALLRKKSEIIEDLKYILPTIPGICPIELDPDKIDNLIEVIKKAQPAA
jgi:hypothetical protein